MPATDTSRYQKFCGRITTPFEHFAASGIDIAQSDDKSKTAIVIKHYFRQQKFKVLLIDNNKGPVFERSFDIKTEKDLINFKHIAVSNEGQILLEARTQEDPLHLDGKGKKTPCYYFFSINSTDERPQMLRLAATIGGNQFSGEPMIAILNNGEMLISYDHYANDHSPVLKGISVNKYKTDFTLIGTQDIAPDSKFLAQGAAYQKSKERGLEYLETRQILPLESGNFMLIAEYHRSTDNKDKITGAITTILERHYVIAYRLDNQMNIKAAHFIDKRQTTHTIGYAFSVQAYRKGNDVYLLHNEDCESDDEHGLSLLNTYFPAMGGEPSTQKIVHTAEDFFTCLEHIYTGSNNRILFTEAKVVDFSVESKELKLLEVRVK